MKNNAIYDALLRRAHEAGRAAAAATTPTPMHVYEADGLTGRPKPGGFRETVNDGPCGFAWVKFAGNTAFGRWAKANGHARKSYPKGLSIWISDYRQSMTLKAAHADAMAKVLKDAGIDCYADSRMD